MKTEKQIALACRLTQREVEILSQAAMGKTRREISSEIGLSEETIKDYSSKIFRKLDAVNMVNAVAIACEAGMISLRGDILGIKNTRKCPQLGVVKTCARDNMW